MSITFYQNISPTDVHVRCHGNLLESTPINKGASARSPRRKRYSSGYSATLRGVRRKNSGSAEDKFGRDNNLLLANPQYIATTKARNCILSFT